MMSVEHALKSILNNFARLSLSLNQGQGQNQRRTKRRNVPTQSTESLEARTLLTLIGTNVLVSHTTQTPGVDNGNEVPFGPRGADIVADDAADPEFASFGGQYDIDIDGSTISMTFNSASAPPTNTATTYRYYFRFELSTNESITAVSAASDATLQPNVSISGNTVVVEIVPGTQIGAGFDALINVDVERTGSVISGRKYHDVNNDGKRDVGESYLNGWTLELRDIDAFDSDPPIATTTSRDIDLDGNGTIDPETESGVYVFADFPAGTYVVQEVIPVGWTQTQPNHPNTTAAFELDTELELSSTGNDFLNWGGLNEKWFYSLAGSDSGTPQAPTAWYYITPDGSIYQWDGSPRTELDGTFVVQLDASFHADPSRVYDAPSARQYIADVDVSAPATFRGLDFGNYLKPTDFQMTENQDTNEVTFNWNAVDGSTYDIWISDIAANRQIQFIPDLDGAQIPLTTELPDRRYRVWVRTNSQGVSSPWSAPQQFEFFRDPVNLITSNRATTIDATPTIEWRPLAGASSYDIRVTNGDQTVYLQNDIAGLSHRVANPLQFGVDYHVAVRANFTDGSQTDWDAGLPIQINGRTTPVVNGNVVTWAPVPAATGYEIWVNRYDESGALVRSRAVATTVTDGTSFTLPALQRGDHAIWIRAIRAEGTSTYQSFWGPRVDFFFVAAEPTEAPETPLLQLASVTTALNDLSIHAADVAVSVPPAVPVDAQQGDDNDAVDAIEAVMAELASSDFLDEA